MAMDLSSIINKIDNEILNSSINDDEKINRVTVLYQQLIENIKPHSRHLQFLIRHLELANLSEVLRWDHLLEDLRPIQDLDPENDGLVVGSMEPSDYETLQNCRQVLAAANASTNENRLKLRDSFNKLRILSLIQAPIENRIKHLRRIVAITTNQLHEKDLEQLEKARINEIPEELKRAYDNKRKDILSKLCTELDTIEYATIPDGLKARARGFLEHVEELDRKERRENIRQEIGLLLSQARQCDSPESIPPNILHEIRNKLEELYAISENTSDKYRPTEVIDAQNIIDYRRALTAIEDAIEHSASLEEMQRPYAILERLEWPIPKRVEVALAARLSEANSKRRRKTLSLISVSVLTVLVLGAVVLTLLYNKQRGSERFAIDQEIRALIDDENWFAADRRLRAAHESDPNYTSRSAERRRLSHIVSEMLREIQQTNEALSLRISEIESGPIGDISLAELNGIIEKESNIPESLRAKIENLIESAKVFQHESKISANREFRMAHDEIRAAYNTLPSARNAVQSDLQRAIELRDKLLNLARNPLLDDTSLALAETTRPLLLSWINTVERNVEISQQRLNAEEKLLETMASLDHTRFTDALDKLLTIEAAHPMASVLQLWASNGESIFNSISTINLLNIQPVLNLDSSLGDEVKILSQELSGLIEFPFVSGPSAELKTFLGRRDKIISSDLPLNVTRRIENPTLNNILTFKITDNQYFTTREFWESRSIGVMQSPTAGRTETITLNVFRRSGRTEEMRLRGQGEIKSELSSLTRAHLFIANALRSDTGPDRFLAVSKKLIDSNDDFSTSTIAILIPFLMSAHAEFGWPPLSTGASRTLSDLSAVPWANEWLEPQTDAYATLSRRSDQLLSELKLNNELTFRQWQSMIRDTFARRDPIAIMWDTPGHVRAFSNMSPGIGLAQNRALEAMIPPTQGAPPNLIAVGTVDPNGIINFTKSPESIPHGSILLAK